MVIGWKAWFVDVPAQRSLHVYSSDNCRWEDLPGDGCLGFIFFEEKRKPDGNRMRAIRTGYDYYFRSGEIYGVDVEVRERNVPEEIAARYTEPVIIRGIWTTDTCMAQVDQEMREAECP